MRKPKRIAMRGLVILFASLLMAGQANAKTMDWHGTLDVDLWGGLAVTLQGSGVATVNRSSGGAHLDTLRIAGGITGSGSVPVTDPHTTPFLKSLRITATLKTATLTGISGAPPMGRNTLPIGGFTRLCLFIVGCNANISMINTKNDGNTGLGVGGILTIGTLGDIRISITAAPWTHSTVTGVNQTVKGNFTTLSRVGFVHGYGSTASSTAATSGVIQMISPKHVTTYGLTGNSTAIALFSVLTLHFIPEPGLLLLLSSGVVGLALLGRGRMKE